MLCVPYKILERLTYACVEPLIDPLLSKEQAGFRRGKSTVDQVVLLTQNIKDSFEAKKKAGAIFINWQLLMILSGTVALSASCWDYFRISTWSEWLWNLSEIEVSPLPPVIASKAGYDF